MLSRSLTLWSRSLAWRLMTPLGLMLALVALLTLVNISTRARVHRAYDAQTASQEVRTDLIEVRSLSRSLQRDDLNLMGESDPSELVVLHDKFRSRIDDMRMLLDRLAHDPVFAQAPQRIPYLRSQHIVLERLAETARLATGGQPRRALATFRQQVRPNERAASRIADALIAEQNADVAVLQRRTGDLERQGAAIGAIASVALFAVAAAVTLLIVRRSVLTPLSDISRAMTLVAAGDTDGETPHGTRQDEIGDMARAIEIFRASIREREALREREAHQKQVAVEDALERERARHRDEEAVATRTAALARSAQALETQVGEVLRVLRSSSTQLAAASRELAGHSSTAEAGLAEVAGAVARALNGATDIAAATDQFAGAIDAASQGTRRSANLSAGAASQSLVLAARMARVRDASRAIETVVNLIAGVAKQTNLLALNASIEAARAGDAGQGFSVVAGEVKQLAGQTARATDSIAGQIADMQHAVHDAGDSLRQIETMVANIAQETDVLATGVGDQATGARVITRNLAGAAEDLNLIDGRVRDVAAAAAAVDALARRVLGDAGLLERSATMINDALSTFFVDLDAVRSAAAAGRGIEAGAVDQPAEPEDVREATHTG